mgnify:CR=1 FL=1
MPKEVRYVYEFGPFRLDPAERLLIRGDQALSLTPKALDTLIVLIENSRHIVTQEELMNRVWPDIYVEEPNLAQHISMLRKVLGEREDGGQFIETVPKRGYRFVVAVKKTKLMPTEADLSAAIKPAGYSQPVESDPPAKIDRKEKSLKTNGRIERLRQWKAPVRPNAAIQSSRE